MADISRITIPNGTVYEIKDAYAMQYPYLRSLGTKTYTDIIASANTEQGGGFFYLKVRGTTWNTRWRIKTRVRATVPGEELYDTDTVFEFWSHANAIGGYASENHILNTSYLPIYYNSIFLVSEEGYNNGCGTWIGFSLHSSTNPSNTSYKRTVIVDVLDYEGCTIELQDALVTPDNIPERSAHTAWYTSKNTDYSNCDAHSQGLKQIGDADTNTTNISTLNKGSGNFIANSAVYRYQLLFQMDENQLTPLNNVNNSKGTSKAMLTNAEFDPFGGIYYKSTTTTVAANAAIGADTLLYAGAFDLRYTFNCGTTLTASKPFYLVVTPTSGGKCKIASASPWAQTLPSTKDGNFYILLGRTYSTYQMMLSHEHPVYMYDGTTVREVLPQTALATTEFAGLVSPSDKIKLNSLNVMTGATATQAGASGVVPVPIAGSQNKLLQGDGTWSDSISIGRKANTTIGSKSTAEGLDTTASSDGAHSEGTNTIASGYCSHTEGSWTVASAQYSHAEGSGPQASGTGAHAEGVITLAEGEGSHAEGDGATAEGHAAHAEGDTSYAQGDNSHAEGYHTHATHRSQHVFGEYNKLDTSSAAATARGNYVEIVGKGTGDSARSNARTLDWNGNEWLAGDLTINGSTASPISLGSALSTMTGATSSTAGTSGTVPSPLAGDQSKFLKGDGTWSNVPNPQTMTGATSSTAGTGGLVPVPAAGDQNKLLQGDGTWTSTINIGRLSGTSVGDYSTAEGDGTTASGTYSHAEGYNTVALGSRSHAEGDSTTAIAYYSHAEGRGTTASGDCSHAEGRSTTASGYYSHAEGWYTAASGNFSHAEGNNTISNHESQHVFGEYNIEDPSTAASNARGNYVEIVGNGTADSSRSNARTLDWNGNEVLAGDLKINANVSVANRILGVENAISIPSPSNSTYYLLDGLTSEHIVVAWHFSSSPENLPPCDLTITTYQGYFMVTNDGGTTTETIKPVFARPKRLTAEQSDAVPGTLVPREGE